MLLGLLLGLPLGLHLDHQIIPPKRRTPSQAQSLQAHHLQVQRQAIHQVSPRIKRPLRLRRGAELDAAVIRIKHYPAAILLRIGASELRVISRFSQNASIASSSCASALVPGAAEPRLVMPPCCVSDTSARYTARNAPLSSVASSTALSARSKTSNVCVESSALSS